MNKYRQLQKYIIKDRHGYDKELKDPYAKNQRDVRISQSTSGKYYEAWYYGKPEKILAKGTTAEGLMRRLAAKKGYGNIRIMD